MRYVRIENLKEGMVNCKPLFGKNNEILLNSGVIIRESYISKLKELGYHGIYIEDSISEGITPTVLIDDNLRIECVKSVREVYDKFSSNKVLNEEVIEDLKTCVDEIINSVLSNKELLINVIDLKGYDDYTYSHSVNVAVLSIATGIKLNHSKNVLYRLGMAAFMHDIGKIFVPKEIINKCGKLTNDEFALVKRHPLKGYELLKRGGNFPHYSCIGILHHHEKYNGTGYPIGLSGEDISLLGRIITISDVYDALTSDRPYREALFPSESVEYIMGGSGTLFDPDITSAFVRIIAPYPVGTCVNLSSKKSGIVVRNYPDFCLRPVIKILFHSDTPVEPYLIDLKNDPDARDVVITGVADF
ncbi:MAG: HD-GYP domain-containing protein [Clostridiaceae bacterium]|nr:HD-GYP domain-containing protein [Clostridiaceae bacterium]